MNKSIMLKDLEKDFEVCRAKISKLKLMYDSGASYLKTSQDLEPESKHALKSELNVLNYSITSAYGELICIGAACDRLRYELTNEVTQPEGGYH